MKMTSPAHIKRSIAVIPALLLALLFGFVNCGYAWDYGNGRHGTYVLTSSTTIEQLYQTVRLTNDPAQYNPADSNAVPNFQNLIITNDAVLSASQWNGSTGGTIILKVQATMFIAAGSSISVSDIGYRGGNQSQQGESYSGSQATSPNANYGGGGGGYGQGYENGAFYTYSGAGGGYGSGGGNGSSGQGGGLTYGTSSLSTNYMGSGGGGGYNGGPNGFFGATINGGNGGGAIEIDAGNLQVQGQIHADGGGGGSAGAGGGGGSGGSILLRVASGILGTNVITANGGGGGYYGGASGGIGRIMIGFAESFTGATTPAAYTLQDTNSDNVTMITNQPVTQTNFLGANVNFNVGVYGLPTLFFQWNFNNVPILGATNQNLPLTNVALTNTGNYSVTISNAVMTILSSNAFLEVLDTITPLNDGIPNWWKEEYRLSTNDPTLATNYPPADSQLTYLEKYLYDLNPLTNDTDGDGISDYDEIFDYHSNPTNAFTAGDGISDGWKATNGLNPSVAYANEEAGFDGVTYMQVYQYDLTHTNQLNPNSPFAIGSGLSDYEIINNGQHTNSYYYDHEDRLLGMESSRGISIGYQYDGNGNLLQQNVLSRASETNGLPLLWLWLNGLTNEPGIAYEDSSGNGWNNYQEWLAGLSPNSNSVPSLLNNTGTNIASITFPFTPSNCVMAAGNLDGLPGDEIVVGADGNPGTATNFLLVIYQSVSGWSTQEVNIGSFGVTSLAIGQPANRPAPAIYAGLRQSGGTGRIMELINIGGVWQTNIVAVSTNEATFVLGVRSNDDLLFSYAPTNGIDGALYSATFSTNWNQSLVDSNTSHRGLGITGNIGGGNQGAVRLLDIGGIQVDPVLNVSIPEPVSTNRYLWRGTSLALETPRLIQTNAFSLIYTFIDDNDNNGQISAGDDFVLSEYTNVIYFNPNGFYDNFPGTTLNGTYWTNIFGNIVVSSNKLILTAVGNTYTGMNTDGHFNMVPGDTVIFEGANIPPSSLSGHDIGTYGGPKFTAVWNSGQTVITAVDGDNSRHSTGVSTSGPTILHEFKIIWNSNGKADYFIDGNNVYTGTIAFSTTSFPLAFRVYDAGSIMWCSSVYCYPTPNPITNSISSQLTTLSRTPITSTNLAQSYGVASVNLLNSSNEVIFTGEPDGQVFAWTATNSSAPLQRQLFTSYYSGKAWHALSAVNMLLGGQGLVGLIVDPTNQNTCNVIFWPPEPVLSSPQPSLFETAPFAAVIPSANPLGSNAVVTVRLWDNEGNASTPFLQYQFLGDTNWQNATLTALDGGYYSQAARVNALPSGSDHTVTWNAFADVGANVVTNVLLRARAQDFMLTGDWSQPTPFEINTTQVASTNSTIGTSQFMPDGRFQLAITGGVLGQYYVLLASTNLVNWIPINGFIYTNPPIIIYDPDAGNYRWRLYRIGPLSLAPAPKLGVSFVQPLGSNGLNLMMYALPGLDYQIEGSTDLVNWAVITNLSGTNSTLDFNDPGANNYKQRFYRTILP